MFRFHCHELYCLVYYYYYYCIELWQADQYRLSVLETLVLLITTIVVRNMLETTAWSVCLSVVIRIARLRWAGHVARMEQGGLPGRRMYLQPEGL
jgi:hypothetical protein